MEHIANSFTPDAATDEPAVTPSTSRANEPDPPEPWLYFQGVAEGIRKCGGIVPPYVLEQAGLGPDFNRPTDDGRDLLDFETVQLRHRVDGWTPARQRQFVEALADSGIIRRAAAAVGMSEQSVSNLRRRSPTFDAACEAALRLGARRLHSIAWERAIEGTLKGHYYHGELKSQERVFDNRLLIYLLGRTKHLDAPSPQAARVLKDWDGWMDAIEQGLPEPVPPPPPASAEEDQAFDGCEVWEQGGEWVTDFPPPEGFDGVECDEWGSEDYWRELTEAERAVIEADEAGERDERRAQAAARRDLYFGFAEAENSSSVQAPTCQTSEPSAEDCETDEPHSPLPARAGPGVGAAETLGGSEPSPPCAQGREERHRCPGGALP